MLAREPLFSGKQERKKQEGFHLLHMLGWRKNSLGCTVLRLEVSNFTGRVSLSILQEQTSGADAYKFSE